MSLSLLYYHKSQKMLRISTAILSNCNMHINNQTDADDIKSNNQTKS